MLLSNIINEIIIEGTIKGVMPSKPMDISDADKAKSYEKLTDVEKNQLNEVGYVPYDLWPVFRKFLLERSMAGNSSLNPELTAYTPGETLHLFNHPIIKTWHNKIVNYKIEGNYTKFIFVPCAKTKPWENASRGIYKDYNKLRTIHPEYFFITISEPLGIVPQTLWKNFPQYDNPGLFKDPVQRSGGLFTRDFKNGLTLQNLKPHLIHLPITNALEFWQKSLKSLLISTLKGSLYPSSRILKELEVTVKC